ncbi:hypothetical protein FACS1894168_3370 [Deltaproteobacteria bacterium]|nr:hypothetical protein FACS1894168_3370 [Deltaproteobacteria bacterium]
MPEQETQKFKPRKPKDFAAINGNCKMAKLSDGYIPRSCPECGTNHKLKKCPWCGHGEGRNDRKIHLHCFAVVPVYNCSH